MWTSKSWLCLASKPLVTFVLKNTFPCNPSSVVTSVFLIWFFYWCCHSHTQHSIVHSLSCQWILTVYSWPCAPEKMNKKDMSALRLCFSFKNIRSCSFSLVFFPFPFHHLQLHSKLHIFFENTITLLSHNLFRSLMLWIMHSFSLNTLQAFI